MKDKNIYVELWQKYRPAILAMMKVSEAEHKYYQLTEHEFTAIGERTKAGYVFNLEISKGKVVNNISGTAVARDLFIVLENSATAKEIMATSNIKITLSNKFVLGVLVNPVE